MSTTQSPPLVSLQAPKDVSIESIEAELAEIWNTYGQNDEGMAAARATTFSFLVYEPDAIQALMAALGFYTGPVDGVAGPRTIAAIKSAQKAYGLPVTGTSNPGFVQLIKEKFKQSKEAGTLTSAAERLTKPYSPDLEGSGIADAIASANPCRIITLCPTTEDDEGVQAQVSAYCPIQKRNQNSLICCEYITLRGTASALERVGGIIAELMIPELPKFIWWKASPEIDYGLFQRLASQANTIIVDSSTFSEPEIDLFQISSVLEKGLAIADLNWSRLAPWQELTAENFDLPERRAAVREIDQIVLDYEKGNHSQALMYLGWVASRLKWRPVGYSHEPGDYDIRRVSFLSSDQRPIEVELAGLPLADFGEVLGDLVSIKLGSTTPDANCGLVLCSSTMGCMRMEAGGSAQSYRIQQVTSLADQKTEQLLSRQLQRWGRDVLYEECMAVLHELFQLIAAHDQ